MAAEAPAHGVEMSNQTNSTHFIGVANWDTQKTYHNIYEYIPGDRSSRLHFLKGRQELL